MSHSVSVDVPRVPSRVAPRIANSMPPRRVSFREVVGGEVTLSSANIEINFLISVGDIEINPIICS